jgi:hypothetical protein
MAVQAVGIQRDRSVAVNAVAPWNMEAIFNTFDTFQEEIF